MADKFLNLTAVAIFKQWAKGLFATSTDFNTLSERVEEIIQEGGEPNVIETVKVNNTALTPDAEKAVNIHVPVIKIESVGASNTFKIGQTDGGNDDTDSLRITPTYNDGTSWSVEFGGGDGFDHQVPTVQHMQSYVEENGGKIDKFKVNGTEQPITEKTVDITVPTKTTDLTNDSGFQTAAEVESAIDEKISAVYKPQGAIAFENLPALSASIEGYVYNITNSFTTTADFIEGAGHTHPAGTNVVCVEHNGAYMWDCLHGAVDLSAYWTSATGEANTLEAATVAEIQAILNS